MAPRERGWMWAIGHRFQLNGLQKRTIILSIVAPNSGWVVTFGGYFAVGSSYRALLDVTTPADLS